MPYSVEFLEDVGVVETVYDGAVAQAELQEALTTTGALAAEKLCSRFLVDCRKMAPSGPGVTMDIWALVELLASLPPGTIEREAILAPASPGGSSDMAFFETAARNRGLDVRVFGEREKALAWLAE